MSRAITRRELARQLNLGEKTVSRGLAGHPDVSAAMVAHVRAAAAAAGMELPLLRQHGKHETRRPRVVADHLVVADGRHLGRFAFDGADWRPDPDGTHDGYEYRLGFYCIARSLAVLT